MTKTGPVVEAFDAVACSHGFRKSGLIWKREFDGGVAYTRLRADTWTGTMFFFEQGIDYRAVHKKLPKRSSPSDCDVNSEDSDYGLSKCGVPIGYLFEDTKLSYSKRKEYIELAFELLEKLFFRPYESFEMASNTQKVWLPIDAGEARDLKAGVPSAGPDLRKFLWGDKFEHVASWRQEG